MDIPNILYNYLANNYLLLIMVIGMFVLTAFDKFLDKLMIRRLRISMVMFLLLSVFSSIEIQFSLFSEPTKWRILFSALCYTIRPLIMVMVVYIVRKKVSRLIFIPAVFNAVVAFSALFTDIAFGFDSNNQFYRGPLGFTPYIVSVLYLIYLIIISIKFLSGNSKQEGIIVLFIALSGVGAALIAIDGTNMWVDITSAADIMMYYLFVYSQYAKRDAQIKNDLVDQLNEKTEAAVAANQAKSAFLSNMSHEIRTPINAILGMNEMILRESEDNDILEYSENVRTAGNTLLGIVNDILDFSKIEAGKMEIISVDYDLSSVLNDLVNMIQTRADNKGLLLKLDFDREIPKLLHGDEVRLKQVITNILTNAVKYTEKGSVTFCISYSKIAGESDSVMLEVAVKDTGIGIKPEDMKKLFSEFERIEEERNRNVEGTGLGMNITQRLLEMMG